MSLPALRSLGLHSDLLVMRGQSSIDIHPDHLILRTPAEPSYWFGNCLIFRSARVAPQAQIAAFHAAFPEARHIVLQWDAPNEPVGPGHAALEAMGFEIEVTDVLVRSDPFPESPPPGLTLRPIDSEADWAQVLALQTETGIEEGYDPATHQGFLAGRIAARRTQIAEGWGCWFGAFSGDLLVGDLGIFTDDRTARYQSVETRADYRRQGICRALVARAGNWAKEKAPSAQLVILADVDNPSAQIYRQFGFRQRERLVAACKPPAGAKTA